MANPVAAKKQRDIGPEWLRIIAMIMIVLSHIATHGNIVFDSVCFNSVFLSVLTMGGKTGVNIFILITGYYSVRSKPTVRKAVILIAQTVFYSTVLYFVSCAVGANVFRIKYLIYALIPFVSNRGYWFITLYILLYALIPFINGGLRKLTRYQHLFLIGLFLFVWSFLPRTYGSFFSEQGYGVSELGWFVLAYSVGAYLSTYPVGLLKHRAVSRVLLASVAALMIAGKTILESGIAFSGLKGAIIRTALEFVADSSLYGPVAFVFAVLSLIVFLQVRTKPIRAVCAIAASTFGIYLIHDSEWLRRFIWDDLFKLYRLTGSSHFVLDVFAVMLLTFVTCGAIDILRKKLLEEPVFSSKLYERAERKIGAFARGLLTRK